MKTRTTTLLLLAFLPLLTAPTAQAEDPPKIKALLIAGGCCHDYTTQTRILTEGISARARVEWKIVRYTATERKTVIDVYKDENWGEGFDVVLHNECYGGVEDVEFVERIAKAHHAGLPGIVLHCSAHSYRAAQTDEWRKCMGVTSRSHEKHRPLEIKVVRKNHPILTDFPNPWPTPNGELYKIEKVWPNTKVLATAYGADTQKDHPIIWTNTFGKGRMFGTTLGHHNETMAHEVYLNMVTRGLLWACGRLRDDGEPADGYKPTKKARK